MEVGDEQPWGTGTAYTIDCAANRGAPPKDFAAQGRDIPGAHAGTKARRGARAKISQRNAIREIPQPDTPSFLPRIEPLRDSRVILIDGDSGSGKTSVLLTLVEIWNRWLLPQQRGAEPGSTVPIFPIGVVDLQPLTPSTNLILHLASTLRKVIETVEGEAFAGALIPPWHPMQQQEENSATAAWRDFLRSAAVASEDSVQQRRELDPEALALELEQVERERLDVTKAFSRLVEALVKDLAQWRRIPGSQLPFLILSIDDAALNPDFSVPLLNLLRRLYHPRLAYLLTGNSELFVTMLRTHFFGALLRPIRGISSRTDLPQLQHQSDWLAQQVYDRLVPDLQRCRIEPLALKKRLQELKGILQLIPLSTDAPVEPKTIYTYFESLPDLALALPNTMRGIIDLREDPILRANAISASPSGIRTAQWLVKQLWDGALHAMFLSPEERQLLESGVEITEQGDLRVDAEYIKWNLTRRRLFRVSCNNPFTAVVYQPGFLGASLEGSQKPARPLPRSAVNAFVLANIVASDDLDDVLTRSAEPPFDQALMTIAYDYDKVGTLSFGWPLPDSGPLLDIMIIGDCWKAVMERTDGSALTMPQLAVLFLDLIIKTADDRLPVKAIPLTRIATTAEVWDDLVSKLSELAEKAPPTSGKLHTRLPQLAEWARERAGLLAAPESGLPAQTAEAFLNSLKQASGTNEWSSVALGLQAARLARARRALERADEKLKEKTQELDRESRQLVEKIDSIFPRSPWQRLVVEETARSAGDEVKH
jgi:hypothetical protein